MPQQGVRGKEGMDSEDGCRIQGEPVNQRRNDDLDDDPEELSMGSFTVSRGRTHLVTQVSAYARLSRLFQ